MTWPGCGRRGSFDVCEGVQFVSNGLGVGICVRNALESLFRKRGTWCVRGLACLRNPLRITGESRAHRNAPLRSRLSGRAEGRRPSASYVSPKSGGQGVECTEIAVHSHRGVEEGLAMTGRRRVGPSERAEGRSLVDVGQNPKSEILRGCRDYSLPRVWGCAPISFLFPQEWGTKGG